MARSSFELTPLDDAPFGVRVTGLDCSVPLGDEVAAELVRAVTGCLVVVIPDQQLSVAEQVRLTRQLGAPDHSWDLKTVHPEDPHIQVIASQARPPGVKSTSQVWHTDQSFTRHPSMFTILHALVIPSEGGQTLFADMRGAYDELPEPLRERVASARAVHSYRYQLGQVRAQRYSGDTVTEEEGRFPDVLHPVVRTHPTTGHRALYLNQLCLARIDGQQPDESDRLLAELYAHALEPARIYTHRWKVGDILLWDNASLMHRGTPTPSTEARLLHRTTTAGPVPR